MRAPEAAPAVAAFVEDADEVHHRVGTFEFARVLSATATVVTLTKPLVDFVIPLGSRYQTIFPHELVDDGSITTRAIGTGPMILKEAVVMTGTAGLMGLSTGIALCELVAFFVGPDNPSFGPPRVIK